jgi:hypothetical protein
MRNPRGNSEASIYVGSVDINSCPVCYVLDLSHPVHSSSARHDQQCCRSCLVRPHHSGDMTAMYSSHRRAFTTAIERAWSDAAVIPAAFEELPHLSHPVPYPSCHAIGGFPTSEEPRVAGHCRDEPPWERKTHSEGVFSEQLAQNGRGVERAARRSGEFVTDWRCAAVPFAHVLLSYLVVTLVRQCVDCSTTRCLSEHRSIGAPH